MAAYKHPQRARHAGPTSADSVPFHLLNLPSSSDPSLDPHISLSTSAFLSSRASAFQHAISSAYSQFPTSCASSSHTRSTSTSSSARHFSSHLHRDIPTSRPLPIRFSARYTSLSLPRSCSSPPAMCFSFFSSVNTRIDPTRPSLPAQSAPPKTSPSNRLRKFVLEARSCPVRSGRCRRGQADGDACESSEGRSPRHHRKGEMGEGQGIKIPRAGGADSPYGFAFPLTHSHARSSQSRRLLNL
jgi:hypothetical protein